MYVYVNVYIYVDVYVSLSLKKTHILWHCNTKFPLYNKSNIYFYIILQAVFYVYVYVNVYVDVHVHVYVYVIFLYRQERALQSLSRHQVSYGGCTQP